MPSLDIPEFQSERPPDDGASETSTWTPIKNQNGIVTFRLGSWAMFYDFLDQTVFSTREGPRSRTYVWRGHHRDDWALSSTLHRLFENLALLPGRQEFIDRQARDHLEAFKYRRTRATWLISAPA